MIYNGRSGDQASQQFAAGVYGRCFSGESLVGVKFKTVTGITSYKQATLSDSESALWLQMELILIYIDMEKALLMEVSQLIQTEILKQLIILMRCISEITLNTI